MDLDAQILYRDGLFVSLIHLFGMSYFVFFLVSFLLHRFPRSPDAIAKAQIITCYSVGVLLWELSSLTYRSSCLFSGAGVAFWERLEMAGTLVLIYTRAIPGIVAAYRRQCVLRSVYLFGLTALAIGKIIDLFIRPSRPSMTAGAFHWDCLWLGLWALVPAFHALRTQERPPLVALELVRLTAWDLLVAVGCLAQIPERLGVAGNWHPSLYLMHLALVGSNIAYAQGLWHMIL